VANVWADVYDLTGITVGDSIFIINKLPYQEPVLIWEGATAPAADSRDGIPLAYGETATVAASSPGVFALMPGPVGSVAQARLCVQEITA
jgi:hypothetical protein